jgi:hypothetical protein
VQRDLVRTRGILSVCYQHVSDLSCHTAHLMVSGLRYVRGCGTQVADGSDFMTRSAADVLPISSC